MERIKGERIPKVSSPVNSNGVQWRIKPYPGTSGYAIQNAMTSKYIPTKTDGSYMNGVGEDNCGIFTLEIKLMGTSTHLNHPYTELDGPYFPFYTAPNSDDVGSILKPRRNISAHVLSPSQPTTPPSQGLGPYIDEAVRQTQLRQPFTRVQRIAALDWARKLGAINVPTIESFDECERRLEAALGSNNNLGRHLDKGDTSRYRPGSKPFANEHWEDRRSSRGAMRAKGAMTELPRCHRLEGSGSFPEGHAIQFIS
ncbi:hypothetical protein AG1IA_07727 [Rhizoctonia solani AG-1 IA]|uniref:Uncharacterized protein n=1 Tax=Thanatephorus cucumeris (strain AG1-IA) TaxID=983506 RepID=L8WJ97_THACA|nr:hypothetical protein AG1IA_07727 [Rhizoctonia solani AG-1 IA]